MSPRKPTACWRYGLIGVLLLGIVAAACSSTPGSRLSGEAPGASGGNVATGSPAAASVPSPTPTLASVTGSAASAVGQELDASHVDALAACGPLSGGATETPNQQLAPGGLDVLTCPAGESSSPMNSVSVVDATHGKVLWRGPVPPGAQLLVGTKHLFYATSTVLPAGPLTSSSTIYGLSGVDITTGKQIWSVPLPVPESATPLANYLTLTEAPSGVTGHADGVLVEIQQQRKMFDADTGQLLYTIPTGGPSGEYQTDGVLLGQGYTDFIGYDAQTGGKLWDTVVPWLATSGSVSPSFLVGNVLWLFFGHHFADINIDTGQLLSQGSTPAQQNDDEAETPGFMAIVNEAADTISLYDLANPEQAVWTIPGTGNPLLMTADALVVMGPLGLVVVSNKDGSILTTLNGAGFGNSTSLPSVVDGLVSLGDGSVLRVGTPS